MIIKPICLKAMMKPMFRKAIKTAKAAQKNRIAQNPWF